MDTPDSTSSDSTSSDSISSDATSFWYESHGTRLFAVARGSGPTLIFWHGAMASHLACDEYAVPLASRFRVITPDLRASGASAFAGPLDWDLLADDVAALLDHLGLEKAAVGGVSSGTGVAVRFALRHPERLSALVLVHPVYAGADKGLSPVQDAGMKAMHAAGSRALDEGVEVLYPLFSQLPEGIREKALAMVAGFDPASVVTTANFLISGLQPFESAADLGAVRAPTLLIPADDPFHPAAASEVHAQNIPDCTVRPASGPEAAEAIAGFLERVAGSA